MKNFGKLILFSSVVLLSGGCDFGSGEFDQETQTINLAKGPAIGELGESVCCVTVDGRDVSYGLVTKESDETADEACQDSGYDLEALWEFSCQ